MKHLSNLKIRKQLHNNFNFAQAIENKEKEIKDENKTLEPMHRIIGNEDEDICADTISSIDTTIIDSDEFVFPMLPPGGSMDDIIVKAGK